jgi:hypothetical protein
VDVAGPYGQTLVEKVKRGKRREVCSLPLRSNASSPTTERRPCQSVSHAVVLIDPMIPSLSPCAVEVSEVIICIRVQTPRLTAYMTALERTTCNRAQTSDLAAP